MNLSGKTIRLEGCRILATRNKMLCFSGCILRCPGGTLRRSNRQNERHIVRRVVDPYCTRRMAVKKTHMLIIVYALYTTPIKC